MARAHLIGIAGPSCAGKSELAHWVAGQVGAPVLSLDSYYLDLHHVAYEERCRMNFDEPAALDHDLILSQVSDLAEGKSIGKPMYDFTRHTRSGELEWIVPAEFVVVEGLLALHWEDIRRLFDTKVYVSVRDELCFARRLERDVRERGRTPESVKKQYEETVRPMALQWIMPTRRFADVEVSGDVPLEQSGGAVLKLVRRRRKMGADQADRFIARG